MKKTSRIEKVVVKRLTGLFNLSFGDGWSKLPEDQFMSIFDARRIKVTTPLSDSAIDFLIDLTIDFLVKVDVEECYEIHFFDRKLRLVLTINNAS